MGGSLISDDCLKPKPKIPVFKNREFRCLFLWENIYFFWKQIFCPAHKRELCLKKKRSPHFFWTPFSGRGKFVLTTKKLFFTLNRELVFSKKKCSKKDKNGQTILKKKTKSDVCFFVGKLSKAKFWAWNNFQKILAPLQFRGVKFLFFKFPRTKKRVFLEKIRTRFCRSGYINSFFLILQYNFNCQKLFNNWPLLVLWKQGKMFFPKKFFFKNWQFFMFHTK